jgi:class 3 adenylate cyclase/tetratricopeptide (TPR) repeat protein
VAACPACGAENPAGAKFCNECGSPLIREGREQRKTVTVLFCDVTGSTALGESVDPEALRALLARYFERMKVIVESHGGTVEKFIGDAVMAVFGVPVVHEDDALRACRAAVDMRDALPELGIRGRIGVNTGEVVTGTAERLATGDAVNVAARLEQAAEPGEVLIGAQTHALVRDAVDVEAIAPLSLRGKVALVSAYRLLAVRGEVGRRHGAVMVGRVRELQALRDAFARAEGDRVCQLFTVLGSAGVGKSRLVYEFVAGLAAATVRGRCLSYGEGITYWPVVEVLKQLGALPSNPAAAGSIRSLLGETEQGTSAEEIAWAFRKLLEERAQVRPLVCVFDDMHWAEETFLDLVEHIADLSRGAPLLLLCMARPELLDRRPAWGGGKLNATSVLLEPLSAEESEQLLAELGSVDGELGERILQAAEGNPLFVEEMLALVREGGGDVQVPATIQALLSARLDQLDPAERGVLECGSVEGRVFHRGAVQALAPDETDVWQRLVSLVRKELVRPDTPQVAGDDAFRFRHLLIRDAAYDTLPKATRADLHQRFADWLQHHGQELVELDEVLGYHLEQAWRYKAELGEPDATLAEKAGRRLAAAGRRALWRDDDRTAAPLLERALTLIRPLRLDVNLELDLAEARETPQAQAAIAEQAAKRAREIGDRAAEALALVVVAWTDLESASRPDIVDDLEQRAREALSLLESRADEAARGRVWYALAEAANYRGHFEERALAAEQALHCFELARAHHFELAGLHWALVNGPRPADEALETLDSFLATCPAPYPLIGRAHLLAMLNRFDEAWELALSISDPLRESSGRMNVELDLGALAAVAGEHELAVPYLRRGCDTLERLGQKAHLSTYAPELGHSLCELGCYEDAEPLAQLGRELAAEQDLPAQAQWRRVQARVHAHRGERSEAEQLVREAVSIIEQTDALNMQGDNYCDLADVLEQAGNTREAQAALEHAVQLYQRKKNLAMVAKVRTELESLQRETPEPGPRSNS